MRRIRGSRFPALILGLALVWAVFLPEIGHSLEHRQAAAFLAHTSAPAEDHHHHHGAAAAVEHTDADFAWAEEHGVGQHPHLDLRPTIRTKVSLAALLAAKTAVELVFDVAEPRPTRVIIEDRLAPVVRRQGPPPPTRAPPIA